MRAVQLANDSPPDEETLIYLYTKMWEVSERRHVRYVHGLNKDSFTKYFYPTIPRCCKNNLIEKFVLIKKETKKLISFQH